MSGVANIILVIRCKSLALSSGATNVARRGHGLRGGRAFRSAKHGTSCSQCSDWSFSGVF